MGRWVEKCSCDCFMSLVRCTHLFHRHCLFVKGTGHAWPAQRVCPHCHFLQRRPHCPPLHSQHPQCFLKHFLCHSRQRRLLQKRPDLATCCHRPLLTWAPARQDGQRCMTHPATADNPHFMQSSAFIAAADESAELSPQHTAHQRARPLSSWRPGFTIIYTGKSFEHTQSAGQLAD